MVVVETVVFGFSFSFRVRTGPPKPASRFDVCQPAAGIPLSPRDRPLPPTPRGAVQGFCTTMQWVPHLGAPVIRLAKRGALLVPCNGWSLSSGVGASRHARLRCTATASDSTPATVDSSSLQGIGGGDGATVGPRPLRVLFYGSGEFAVETLYELAKST